MAIHVAIDGYDSLEQIGIGGMAAVYRARKVSIDKTVAIKVLFPYLATDETFIDRFQREAKAAASIQHENIVNVIDFGESDGAFYIVMEYYDGRTLEQLVRERPGLPAEIALLILLEVAYGLEAAHARDIVHRDIKPANIIFTNQGGVKIADFGLARKSDSMTMITQHGKVLGTPAYMSPEQAAGRPVGPASDIFSFGIVAYELLGRRKPFDGRTYSEVLDQIQTFDPPPVTAVAPEFARIIARALAKNEGDRHRDAAELIGELEAAMDAHQVSRDRRRLAAYAKNPDAYEAAVAQDTVKLSPVHGEFESTRVLESRAGDATHVLPATPSRAAASRRRRRLRARVIVAAGAVIVAGAIAGAWFASSRRGGQEHVRSASGGQPTSGLMTSTMSETTAVPPAESLVTVVPQAKTGEAGRKDPTSRETREHTPDTTVPTPRSIVKPEPAPATTTAATTTRAEKSAPAIPAVKAGSLSVYFLGGVGQVWIDGKLFAKEPPFEKAALGAGEHRIGCRMSGDDTTRELTVTIRSDRETVIEYEVGGAPVVVDE